MPLFTLYLNFENAQNPAREPFEKINTNISSLRVNVIEMVRNEKRRKKYSIKKKDVQNPSIMHRANAFRRNPRWPPS